MLDKFLADTDSSDTAPVAVNVPKMVDPGPVPPYVPLAKEPGKKSSELTH
jgi:hypothetical protein